MLLILVTVKTTRHNPEDRRTELKSLVISARPAVRKVNIPRHTEIKIAFLGAWSYALVRVSFAMKRHHDHRNSFIKKNN